jgi:cyclohexanone monooxygenase
VSTTSETDFDAIVVGAGFAGLYMLHRLRGMGLGARVYEAGEGVGGTWFWNAYPGARCDIESLEYSYQFDEALQQEWVWTERYAAQPEILAYLNHVADRFDLRGDIQFSTRVVSAVYDEAAAAWTVTPEGGEAVTARYCIMATGCLSSSNIPAIEALDSFKGRIVHTGAWPREGVDFTGKRVAVIGTGSSGIQAIPEIAKQAAQLTVFQRTASYSIPARNAPLDPQAQAKVKANYKAFREHNAKMPIGSDFDHRDVSALAPSPEDRDAEYERRWNKGGTSFGAAYNDIIVNPEANKTAADFVRGKIREIVKDPAVAEALLPSQTFACKRLCLDTDYYATFNRPNVRLVDIKRAPVERITPEGLTAGGEAFGLDVIVFATGFDAMTGALHKIDIRGKGGLSLKDKWAEGPRTYLGLQTEGFPNLFTITGPQSPSVFTNMVPSIEQHVNFIADCIAYMRAKGFTRIEPERPAEDAWVEHVGAIAASTLYPTCNSWYLGANIPGKPRVFLAHLGFPPYVERCNEVAARGYEGFVFA